MYPLFVDVFRCYAAVRDPRDVTKPLPTRTARTASRAGTIRKAERSPIASESCGKSKGVTPIAIREARAARAAARSVACGQAASTRLTVVGYRRATPRPARRSPAPANASVEAAQNNAKPAAATAVHASTRTRGSGTRRMIRVDKARAVAIPTRNSDASAGAWLGEARSQAITAE